VCQLARSAFEEGLQRGFVAPDRQVEQVGGKQARSAAASKVEFAV
jgi:hypothetical protein